MLPILFSLSAMLFDHSRSPVLTPSLRPDARASVTIVTDGSPAVPDWLANAMLLESALIWKPLGVDVRGSGADVLVPTSIVHVIVTDDPAGDSLIDGRLGWIRFVEPNHPEPVIYLSRFAARRLLDGVAAARGRPAAYRDVLLSRIMGRALAHELGHYLLASTAHSSYGLMRGSLPVDLLIANDRAAFRLGKSRRSASS